MKVKMRFRCGAYSLSIFRFTRNQAKKDVEDKIL